MVQVGLFSIIGAGLIMLISGTSAKRAVIDKDERTFYCDDFDNAIDRTKDCCHAVNSAEVWLRGNLTYCLVPDPAASDLEFELYAHSCCNAPDFHKDD